MGQSADVAAICDLGFSININTNENHFQPFPQKKLKTKE